MDQLKFSGAHCGTAAAKHDLPSFPAEGIVMQVDRKVGGEPLLLRISAPQAADPVDLNTPLAGLDVQNTTHLPVVDAVTGRHIGNVAFTLGTCGADQTAHKVALVSALELAPSVLDFVKPDSLWAEIDKATKTFAVMNQALPVKQGDPALSSRER